MRSLTRGVRALRVPLLACFAAVLTSLVVSEHVAAGAPDAELVRVANWLVGAYESKPGAALGAMASAPTLKVRALQDPVVFGDGLYAYVELTRPGEGQSRLWQRVYRLKKSGGKVRVEVMMLDSRVLSMLASDPQMLSNLAPADLLKESGCDIVLESRGGETYTGSASSKSCLSREQGTAERQSYLEVSKDKVVIRLAVAEPPSVAEYEFHRLQP